MVKLRLSLTALLMLGCATVNTPGQLTGERGDPQTPTPIAVAPCASARAALSPAIAGLWWVSESDHPWEYWQPSAPLPTLPTPDQFLALIERAGEPIEVREWRQYLAFASTEREDMSVEERESARRYQNLIQTLANLYSDIVVYKVGAVEVSVYLLGVGCDGVSGIRTLSIET